ncbi:hypothetical protein ACE193_06000 [Bernardetia sp. OM2101]|uniref:hypothetical protein n=1 Tax=Bernardetia sp. OM2101 TaxID=3344876 RepID=UPI0035CF71E9
MNNYFLTAGILCFILGVVHSILGEIMIFNGKRNKNSVVPSKRSDGLKERHLRIIWATWHLASVFGWCLAGIIIQISLIHNELNAAFMEMLIQLLTSTMFIGSCLVLLGTKGKHPGWIVLLAIGILLIVGNGM